MLTVKYMERLWNLRAYSRLIDELCTGRAEAVGGIRQLINGPIAAAALIVIRLHELLQSHQPFASKMIRFLVSSQASDGGFDDVVSTALVIRALSSDQGQGSVLDSAIHFLDLLQKEDGQWPREPLRRMPGDPAVTAFVLLQLIESRLPQSEPLIYRTVHRITDEQDRTNIPQTSSQRPSSVPEESIDQQLQLLRRRIVSRQPTLFESWS